MVLFLMDQRWELGNYLRERTLQGFLTGDYAERMD